MGGRTPKHGCDKSLVVEERIERLAELFFHRFSCTPAIAPVQKTRGTRSSSNVKADGEQGISQTTQGCLTFHQSWYLIN